MVKVLIVEDSVVISMLLRSTLEQGGMEVVGEARDGHQALRMVSQLKPDVVAMDIHMPNLDGYQATRQLMTANPLPIVLVTATEDPLDAAVAMRALDAGALAVVQKPRGPDHSNYQQDAAEFVRTVRNMAQVKVITRLERPQRPVQVPGKAVVSQLVQQQPKIVALGASTGGPMALRELLSGLHGEFPWPVVAVQHISHGFIASFCSWLNEYSAIPVHVAKQHEIAKAGHLYLAPDDYHLGVRLDSSGHCYLQLAASEPWQGQRPSVGYLFNSVAQSHGGHSMAVLLSGMGADGAVEMLALKAQGALTIVQDKDSAVVHGMPGAAVRLNAANYTLCPQGIAAFLNVLALQYKSDG
ncbi:chemotaxis-specific protein-glutamate methyltransferase CheB [Alkalimonas amylolytica]|uniref:protein-glutamate methylesterase n=1 Tax=Alkalimonas amylolytica TaxID=152573 RepID=A0A1H3ZIT4_ALKAM|nr:chemotaxis-specific protein-glutamate methyltransferase CheB [Alkalimonas amylolytica]SEA23311.1 two-component system, chemotaxis family, response regulator CheB [Alkalimonas amylolytica]